METADTLTFGSELRGALGSDGDDDYFKFTTDSAGLVTLSFDNPRDASSSVSALDFFRLSVEHNGEVIASQNAKASDVSFSFAAQEAGDYYLKITNPLWGYVSTDEYGITATFDATADISGLETESNDTTATADNLVFGQSITGTISYVSAGSVRDFDYYVLNATKPGQISLTLTHAQGASSVDATLLDSNGNSLGTSTFSDGQETLNATVGSAGSYYVQISGNQYDTYDL